jgi:hypothetical protein
VCHGCVTPPWSDGAAPGAPSASSRPTRRRPGRARRRTRDTPGAPGSQAQTTLAGAAGSPLRGKNSTSGCSGQAASAFHGASRARAARRRCNAVRASVAPGATMSASTSACCTEATLRPTPRRTGTDGGRRGGELAGLDVHPLNEGVDLAAPQGIRPTSGFSAASSPHRTIR